MFNHFLTQAFIVGDILWVKAMIPHHSIAILTSERADIQDPEVKKWLKILLKLRNVKLKK